MKNFLTRVRDAAAPFAAALLTFAVAQTALNFPAYENAAGVWAVKNFPRDFAAAEVAPAPTAPAAPLPPRLPTLGTAEVFPGVATATDPVPPDFRIRIPRLGVDAPVVETSEDFFKNEDWVGLENAMQKDLERGVVRYPGSAVPGAGGNIVLTGHSSYYPWSPGRYKDIFAGLPQLAVGDRIEVFYGQKKRVFEISDTRVVLPTAVDVLKKSDGEKLTLITCVPLGTDWKRQVVTALPVADA